MPTLRTSVVAAAICAFGLAFAPASHANPLEIFFPYQHAEAMPEAQEVAQQAAQQIIAAHVASVTVKGHCSLYETLIDDHGDDAPPEYCTNIALKRAQMVRDLLYAAGVPGSVSVNAVSVGFNEPAMPEPMTDHVRANIADKDGRDMLPGGEPLNRNVDIVF